MQSFPSNSEPHVEKLASSSRVSRACTECRRAKVRCYDEQTPACTRCRLHGIDCTFDLPQKKMNRIQRLEDEMAELRRMQLEILAEFWKWKNSASLPPRPKSPTHSSAALPPPIHNCLPYASRCHLLPPNLGNYFPDQDPSSLFNPEPIRTDKVPNQFQLSTPSTNQVWSGPHCQGSGAPWEGLSEGAVVHPTIGNSNRLHGQKRILSPDPERRKAKRRRIQSQSPQSETSQDVTVEGITSELNSAAWQHNACFTGVEGNLFASSSSRPAVEMQSRHAHFYPEVEQLDHSTAVQGISQQRRHSHQIPTISESEPMTTDLEWKIHSNFAYSQPTFGMG